MFPPVSVQTIAKESICNCKLCFLIPRKLYDYMMTLAMSCKYLQIQQNELLPNNLFLWRLNFGAHTYNVIKYFADITTFNIALIRLC